MFAPRRPRRLEATIIVRKLRLQFNGHETSDGKLILKHVGKLGFEGVVSTTIDAPYASGNRGLSRKVKALNREEFVIVVSDPEGSRPYLGALLLGSHADEGKPIYAAPASTGTPDRVLADRLQLSSARAQNAAA